MPAFAEMLLFVITGLKPIACFAVFLASVSKAFHFIWLQDKALR